MNPRLGWVLALAALAIGASSHGWRGFALAASVVVFWLMLQFNRSLRVMRSAAESPVGRVPSAVMLHAKLRSGLPMLQVVALTRSLGRSLGGTPEQWAWGDDSGTEVRVAFVDGRASSWSLVRRDPDANGAGDPPLSSTASPPPEGIP